MLAAARKYKRVVQVGTQRRSTPHLIEARNDIVKSGKLGKVGLVEIYCYYHMRNTTPVPDTTPPDNLDYEMWTGPAPLRPLQQAGPPARVARLHGIRQRDRRRHVRAHAGHDALDAGPGLPETGQLVGRDPGEQGGPRPTSPTRQTATFDYGDLQVVWQHRTWGGDADANYPWGATFYGDKGDAQGQRDAATTSRRSGRRRRRSTKT